MPGVPVQDRDVKLHALPPLPPPPTPPPARPASAAIALPFQAPAQALTPVQPAAARRGPASARGDALASPGKAAATRSPALPIPITAENGNAASPVAYKRGSLVDVQA
jgi:hypothetical protein